MTTLWEDIQFAWRNFFKNKSVCTLIIITLALGIGANAAIFSMVYKSLLGPLPFEEGERLVKIKTHNPNIDRQDITVSVPTMFDYRNQNETFSNVVEYHQMFFSLLGHGDPIYVDAGVVSWDYFEMLNIRPILGRTFLPGEDEPGAKHLIVMSYDFWRDHFNSDPNVIGTKLEMNDFVHEVIGVLPPMPAYPEKNDIWVGAAACPARRTEQTINFRESGFLTLFGKMKPETSLEKATLDINTISKRLQSEYPDDYPAARGLENTVSPLRTEMAGQSATTFFLLMAITGLVLLIACANVANLNLARTTVRKQELAVREALGANPRRIARQVLTESILLSLVGGVVGLVIAFLSIGLLASFAARFTPLASQISIDSSVLVFCLFVSVLTGVISGATAAFQKRNINQSLKEGSGNITASNTSQRVRQGLLVVQFSLAFIVLVCASLVSLSLYRLSQQELGFRTTDIVAVDILPNYTDYAGSQFSSPGATMTWKQFVEQTAEELENSPEINGVAYASFFPLENEGRRPSFFQIESQPPSNINARPSALWTIVSPNYYEVLNISLLQGRYFEERDDDRSERVVIVNQQFSEQFFPDQDPVNQRLSLDGGQTWSTIVGVVSNVREVGIDQQPVPTFYTPNAQTVSMGFRMMIDSRSSLSSMIPIVNDVVYRINPRQSIIDFTTLQFIREDWLSSSRLTGILISLFGGLAFLITLSGVIGVVAYNVSQRRKEVGIRVALGANPNRIRSLFTVQGLAVGLIGIGIGSLFMAFFSPLVKELLFETNPLNPGMYLLTALLVITVAAGAILLPTRQATAIQPNQALREQ